MPNSGQNRWFYVLCQLEIRWMTLKNNGALLLCYFKFCASFHSHLWIQTGVTVWKCQIWVKIDDFIVLCDLEISQMTMNKANLRDLVAATGLVILLKLDSNRRFFARVTLKFDGWSRKIIRHVFYTTSSFNLCIISDPSGNSNWRYSPETVNLCQNQRFVEPCDLRIWCMTLKNNRAPLLFYLKLCASFRSHWWIQTGDTVRKWPIWVKIDNF